MASSWIEAPHLRVFKQLNDVLVCMSDDFPVYCFKPRQIQCWDDMLNGSDIIGLFPTGYEKSILNVVG